MSLYHCKYDNHAVGSVELDEDAQYQKLLSNITITKLPWLSPLHVTMMYTVTISGPLLCEDIIVLSNMILW